MDIENQAREIESSFGSCIAALIMTLLILLTLLLSGCGSNDETGAGSLPVEGITTMLEGRVADGYLVNALVFLDINGNKRPDTDEPQALTTTGGHYSLAIDAGQELLYPVVVQLVAEQTIDEDSSAFVGLDSILESPIGRHQFISPLTTLVKQELDKNALYREVDAENLVKSSLGLGNHVDIWQDYIEAKTTGGNQLEWDKTHETAKVLNHLNGQLLDEFRQNLGGQLADEDYLPATAAVSDLIMQHAKEISDSFLVTPMSAGHLQQLIDQILQSIDLFALSRPLLNHYRQLIDRHPNVWDATAPAIVSRSPGESTSVPVNSPIEIFFNEELDQTTLQQGTVTLFGGGREFPGAISFDSSQQKLTMTPFEPLYAFTDYAVEIAADISDPTGNQIGQQQPWQFQTLFDHSPPALPDF